MAWWRRIKTPKTVQVYMDEAGKWRWKALSGNNKTVDASEQGYSSKYYAMNKATRYAEAFDCPVVYYPEDV